MYENSFTEYKTNGWLKPGSLAEAAQKILIGESTELEEGADAVIDILNNAKTKEDSLLNDTINIATRILDKGSGSRDFLDILDDYGDSDELLEDILVILDKAEEKATGTLKTAIGIAKEILERGESSTGSFRNVLKGLKEDDFEDIDLDDPAFDDNNSGVEVEEDDVADRANQANSALMALLGDAEDSADPDLKLAIQIAMDNLGAGRYQEELFDAIETSASRK